MNYFDDMQDEYGFNDGAAAPPGAELYREVYILAINAVAEEKGSDARAIAFNRPGAHNSCMILTVPLDFFKTLSLSQVLGHENYDAKHVPTVDAADEAFEEAVADCRDLDLDSYVDVKSDISLEFQHLLETLNSNARSKPAKFRFFVSGDGKNGTVVSPDVEFSLTVDLDDVDGYRTMLRLKKTIAILTEHWNDPKYQELEPEKDCHPEERVAVEKAILLELQEQ